MCPNALKDFGGSRKNDWLDLHDVYKNLPDDEEQNEHANLAHDAVKCLEHVSHIWEFSAQLLTNVLN